MTTEVRAEEPESSGPDKGAEGSGFSAFQHHYYHRDDLTDLQAMRLEAGRRLIDRRFPETSVIHHHAADQDCRSFKHQVFKFEEGTNGEAHGEE